LQMPLGSEFSILTRLRNRLEEYDIGWARSEFVRADSPFSTCTTLLQSMWGGKRLSLINLRSQIAAASGNQMDVLHLLRPRH
jgi:hypothetical protein